jgi:hypothetical protein
MTQVEIAAGDRQTIVVYTSDDTGSEIDAPGLLAAIATDAATRERSGEAIVSMTAIPQRHAAAYLGRQGSGYETKVSIAVTYAAPAIRA